MLMTTPIPEGDTMSLDTHLFFFQPDDDAPPLHRRDVMDAIVGRLPDFEWRQRIDQRGALRVAMNEFAWLFDERGIETLFDPPILAFLTAVRRFGDAPVYLSPLDLLRRFHALGWIPPEQHHAATGGPRAAARGRRPLARPRPRPVPAHRTRRAPDPRRHVDRPRR
jgi:hypothetical protein